LTLINLVITFY